MNSHVVLQLPNVTIYQYDVIIGNGQEARGVQRACWNSKVRKSNTGLGPDLIYDGNKLAWSMKPYGQVRMIVDLDVENGRQPDTTGKQTFRIHVNQTKSFSLNVLNAYMSGQASHTTQVLEGINFLDHLMREGPSNDSRLVPLKASFFRREGGDKMDLGGSIEAWRGIFQSVRPAQGNKMVINLDVSNTTFWKPQGLLETIIQKNGLRDPSQIANVFNRQSDAIATGKYLKKLNVKAFYKGNPAPEKEWKIEKVASVSANTHRIKWRVNGQDTGEMVTVTAYFQRKYNLNLKFPALPMIQVTKKMRGEPIYFPMEILVVREHQRYATKLDENQTANMIKFAVSPPAKRLEAIQQGKSWLNWGNDNYMKNYGLRIDPNMLNTNARILPPPGVKFKNKTEEPGTKGRWDLRGKAFITPNPTELKSWGIGFFNGRTSFTPQTLEKFYLDFVKQYKGHGGVVANGKPHMMPLNNDPGTAVNELYQATGNAFKQKPQLLIFLVQNRNSQHYLRIKKSCDCRFGVVSQVMQAQQVAKGQPQYYSNVLMKVNAKLGGATAQAQPGRGSGFSGSFSSPTCFIGADVSHASPGSDQASMAAVTLSFDRFAGRYAAGCQTNGRRVEMITPDNWRSILGPLMQEWMARVGGGRAPGQVYYVRDGVSEQQFAHVLQQEVPEIKAVLDKAAGGKWQGKITTIIAAKRHHIRAFPKASDADQKGNPLPGTLIERDVTSPNEFDFYLYTHIALQGTSRPTHYTVIQDEANHKPSAIQNMLYEHCYQYMRSTTSVSLHPAAYYAHLASNRAKAHENIPASAGPQGGAGYKAGAGSSDTPKSSEVAKLMPLHTANGTGIQFAMWYI